VRRRADPAAAARSLRLVGAHGEQPQHALEAYLECGYGLSPGERRPAGIRQGERVCAEERPARGVQRVGAIEHAGDRLVVGPDDDDRVACEREEHRRPLQCEAVKT
jgi:hypothetical protein